LKTLATAGIRAIALVQLLAFFAAPVRAADPAAATAPAADDDRNASLTEINKKLTNPVSSIWSFTFQQNNYRLTFHQPNSVTRWSSNLLFQPVLPVAITGDWNLITRPVIPLFVSQPHPNPNDPTKNARNTNFGDITLLNMLSPSPNLVGNWLLGLGPTWMFPTAGSDFTGQGKWQVGPAGLVGYLSDKWILGAFPQVWWSFAGPNSREATESLNLQPIASYFLPDGWSVGYSGNVLANFKARQSENVWTVPIGLEVAKVHKLGKLPVRFALAGQWMPVHPEEAGQKWNIQLVIAPVIPKLIKGNLADPSHLQFGLGN
jgi:hypothetical protein